MPSISEVLPVVAPADHVSGPAQGNWTYADYANIPDDGRKYEVARGVLYMAPAPGERHQYICMQIAGYLWQHVREKDLGTVYSAPFDVELSSETTVQPDVLVVLKQNRDRITPTRIVGAPDLVVEVVPVAIVIGLDCITGLQTARLLAARGVPVVGIASDVSHFCARTNVCQEVIQATTSDDGLIETLNELRGRLGARPILFPCTDASVLLLSRERGRLDDLRFALPDHDVVEMLLEKPAMTRHAQDQGFRIPASFEVGNRHDLDTAMESLRFPCVLKPAVKDARWISHASRKAFEARDREALVRIFETCSGWSDRFIVQEWIEGPESELYSCNCYFSQEGIVLADFVARKIRQWPPGTGTSALGIECRSDEVREETLRLFRGVGYVGLGYVEMKRDQRSGEFFLIEPNVGRPTGRSAIAEAGGVELLHSMYCDLAGLPLPTQRSQSYGQAKWIYLRHDLQAAVWAWRRGELTLRDWWTSLSGPKSFAVLSLRDPMPCLYDVLGATSKALAGLLAKLRRPQQPANPVSRQQPGTTP